MLEVPSGSGPGLLLFLPYPGKEIIRSGDTKDRSCNFPLSDNVKDCGLKVPWLPYLHVASFAPHLHATTVSRSLEENIDCLPAHA